MYGLNVWFEYCGKSKARVEKSERVVERRMEIEKKKKLGRRTSTHFTSD